jgi:uncharacterized protein GlcG (DUF336 family)
MQSKPFRFECDEQSQYSQSLQEGLRMHQLDADTALQLIEVARRSAEDHGLAMSLAVVDGGGHPLAMLRMDGASLLSAGTVIAKARTAVFCRRPTHISVERARVHPEVYASLAAQMEPGMVYSMGGYPLERQGSLLGAIAASGGSGEQDMAVAEAAVKLFAALCGGEKD